MRKTLLCCLLLMGCVPDPGTLEDGLTDCIPQGELADDVLVLVDGNGGQVLATRPLVAPLVETTPERVALDLSRALGRASFVGSPDSELWPFLVEGPSIQGEADTYVTDRSGTALLRASIMYNGEGRLFEPAEWSAGEVYSPAVRSSFSTPTCTRTPDPVEVSVVPLGTSSRTRKRQYAAMTVLSQAVASGPRRTSAVIFGVRTGVPSMYSTFWLFSSRSERSR